MKMRIFIKRRNLGAKVARASALCLLALGAALFQAREARAQWTTSGTNTTTTNTVGIGTAAPSRALSLEAPVAPAIGINAAGVERGAFGVTTHASNWFNGTVAGDTILRSQTSDLWIGTYASSKPIRFVTHDAQRLIIDGTGNVGVGTSAPAARFHVVGANAALGSAAPLAFSVVGGVGSSTQTAGYAGGGLSFQGGAGGWNTTGSSYYYSGTGGAVELRGGTGGKHLFGVSHAGAGGVINITGGTGGEHNVAGHKGGTGGSVVLNGGLGGTGTTAGPAGNVLLANERGNVGIGTTAPASKLHVVGDITVTGNINAKYQDLAEWVPSTQKIAAGTVVVLDTARDNHVLSSKTSYDTRVAGVISAQPGIALGEAGDGKVLVATTGRVKVRVDATQGPIKVGDLLVTSDREGYAMKSEPVLVGKRQMHTPGTLIGKALESLAGGTGEILVLLSLQ